MKKFISKIRNNIKKIIISSFAPGDLGFQIKDEIFENEELFLNDSDGILFCHIKANQLENEKNLVRMFVDDEIKDIVFIGKGKEVKESDSDGYLVLDHVNMSGKNPLRGPNDNKYGVRFPDMSGTYKNQISEDKLKEVNLKKAKLLIPKNITELSTIEKDLLLKYEEELQVISEETYYGVITAKHAGIPVESLILINARKVNSLFT